MPLGLFATPLVKSRAENVPPWTGVVAAVADPPAYEVLQLVKFGFSKSPLTIRFAPGTTAAPGPAMAAAAVGPAAGHRLSISPNPRIATPTPLTHQTHFADNALNPALKE
jgi:hypothetical protein